MRAVFLGIFMFIVGISSLFAGEIEYPDDVQEALEKAGENRRELEMVLGHYGSAGDSLKLEAALFLIANMEGHGYATYMMHDSSGAEVEFNVLDYPDFQTLQTACDSIEADRGELDFEKKEIIYDIENISSEYLINQIDYAFRAWTEKPWARDFSFDQFCQYILPYRGSNEPLEDWRKALLIKYSGLEAKMVDPADPLEAASLINDDIKSWFGFDPRFYYHPTDQGLSEMIRTGLGRCEDMTNLAIYALRANGLAITSDYTPYWANSGNNHAWNAIATPDGKVIPFMGAESNPGVYRLANKLAKVYRKMFGKQRGNLVFQDRKQEETPRWLSGKSYIDVTADYTDVCDVTVIFEKEVPDSVDIAYLCVFNSGEWKAIHWARIERDKATFTDMGSDDIVYLPALYLNEEIEPWGPPFVLSNDCAMINLRRIENETISAQLISTTRRKQEISTDGVARTFLSTGKEYELFYWDDGWRTAGREVATDAPLKFEVVPAGCLYRLVEEDSDDEERIFTIEKGAQVWW